MIGDLSGDSQINIYDIVLLVELLFSLHLDEDITDEELLIGDIVPDGQLNVIDIIALVNMILDN